MVIRVDRDGLNIWPPRGPGRDQNFVRTLLKNDHARTIDLEGPRPVDSRAQLEVEVPTCTYLYTYTCIYTYVYRDVVCVYVYVHVCTCMYTRIGL